MTQSTNRIGRIGEQLAVNYLQQRGYVIVERNWRAAADNVRGEIDVIARDGATLVICEVKTRRRSLGEGAFAAVTGCKQRQIRRLAALYLAARVPNVDVRFDVVAVSWLPQGGAPVVEHVMGAF